MARIRTIKPEFWTDAALIECSLNARLLFIGTWNFADDAGNLDRSPKQIKARIFPADALDCDPLIGELIAHGLLTEYSVNGKKYLHISGFTKHQVINRPGKPQCPPFDESLTIQTPFTESSVNAPAGREGKGREWNGKNKGSASRLAEIPEGVDSKVWQDFQALRKTKRAPLTATALQGIAREAGLAGLTLDQALRICCERGWQSLKADWLNKSNGATGNGKFNVQAASRKKLADALAAEAVGDGASQEIFPALPPEVH